MDYLTYLNAEGATLRHEIGGKGARIGRASDNDVVIHGTDVSRIHAEIVRGPEGHLLADLGSKNGTFLNDRAVKNPVLLRAGDRIVLGKSTLLYNASPSLGLKFSDRPLPEAPDSLFLPARSVSSAGEGQATGGDKTLHSGPAAGSSDQLGHVVSEVNRELFPHRPLDDVLEKVMDLVQRHVGYERGLLMLLENGEMVTRVRRLPQNELGGQFEVSRAVIQHVRRVHESVLVRDALEDERFSDSTSLQDHGIQSIMCVPLLGREEIGAIYVDRRRLDEVFTSRELRDLTFLANVTAVKIENAQLQQDAVDNERRNVDVIEAARIQRLLLPAQPPPIVGYDVDGSTFPCHEVGGDYYDYLEFPDGCWGVVVADVAGKGIPAGIVMSNFQARLQAACELDLPLATIFERLNRRFCQILPENRFIAVFLGVLNPATNTLSFVNAGQSAPLLVRRDGSVERLELGSLPLGMFDHVKFNVETVSLRPGDLLCCYSDGVTDAENPSGEFFGEKRLVEELRQTREQPPPAILDHVIAAVDGHCASLPHQDDVTVLIMKRTTETGDRTQAVGSFVS